MHIDYNFDGLSQVIKKRISNTEYRMSNNEGMNSIDWIRKTERNDSILRNSAVRC